MIRTSPPIHARPVPPRDSIVGMTGHGADGPGAFDAIAPSLGGPMIIATTAGGGRRAGCLVGFATQAGIDPPRFLVCLSVVNRTYRVALEASHLAVHVLAADQRRLAELGRPGDQVLRGARAVPQREARRDVQMGEAHRLAPPLA